MNSKRQVKQKIMQQNKKILIKTPFLAYVPCQMVELERDKKIWKRDKVTDWWILKKEKETTKNQKTIFQG